MTEQFTVRDDQLEAITNVKTKQKALTREIECLTKPHQKQAGHDIIARVAEIRELLPRHAKGREQQLVLRALIYCREKLLKPVDPDSFVTAVLKAAEFGLAIDGRLAHALPFADKTKDGVSNLVFIPDYKGMIAVAKWRGVVDDVRAYVVYGLDTFEPPTEDQDGHRFKYQAAIGGRGKPIGAICILEFPDKRRRCIWMPEKEIEKVRAVAKTQKVWDMWEDEMRCKAVTRRGLKTYQDNPEIRDLLSADDAAYDLGENDYIDIPTPSAIAEPKKPRKRKPPKEVTSDPVAPEPDPEVKVGVVVSAEHAQLVKEKFDTLWKRWSELRHDLDGPSMVTIRNTVGVGLIDRTVTIDELQKAIEIAEGLKI